jgi:hypothetical protein
MKWGFVRIPNSHYEERRAPVLLTKERLKEGLLQIGLEPGDHVMMHSSLKSFGFVAGGADTVLDAVLDAVLETVGDEGTLLVPTNTFNGSLTVYLRSLQEIDLRTTPSQMGKITETARTRPDFIRSIHPTHPVAGSGKLAQGSYRLKAGLDRQFQLVLHQHGADGVVNRGSVRRMRSGCRHCISPKAIDLSN